MDSLGPSLCNALVAAVKRADRGRCVVGTSELKNLWKFLKTSGSLSERARFTNFIAKTGAQFQIQPSEQSSHSESFADTSAIFDANILYVLLFDSGFSLQKHHWDEFLASVPARLQSEHSGGDAASTSSSSQHFDSGPGVPNFGGDMLPPRTDRRGKSMRSQIYGLMDATHGSDEQHGETASQSETQSDRTDTSKVDVGFLLGLLKEKDDRIKTLTGEKRLLKQQVRRMKVQMVLKDDAHKNKLATIQAKQSFDLQYCSDVKPSKKAASDKVQSWSWLTPPGVVNAAAPWLKNHVYDVIIVVVVIFHIFLFWLHWSGVCCCYATYVWILGCVAVLPRRPELISCGPHLPQQ